MTRSKPLTFLASAAVLPLIALSVTACGGGGAATASPPPAKSKTTTTPVHTATVKVANGSLGSILVDSQGRTLYLFKADSATKSACSGACAWPPLLAKGKPTAGNGVSASKLTTIKRSGGEQQVTYNGHPLYLFIMDQRSGQTSGQSAEISSGGEPSARGAQTSQPACCFGESSLGHAYTVY
jgi:predicted lipoprotein with Yx(FWY)xxD motif